MTLYLDSSALVKRYVKEAGSETVVEAMTRAQVFKMCRVGLVETERAVSLGGGPEEILRVRRSGPARTSSRWTRVWRTTP